MSPRALLALLRSRGLAVAVAESCTGGSLSEALTRPAGASAVFLGGVVAYADAAKSSILGVPAATLRRHGAVSRETAVAMAQGARRRFGASGAGIGVGVTGIAGPGGAVPGKPVGTVWFAVAGPGRRVVAVRKRFPGTRDQVRRAAVRKALALLEVAAVASPQD